MRILLQNKFLYIRFHTLPTANDTANVTERKVILFTLHILTLSVLAIFFTHKLALWSPCSMAQTNCVPRSRRASR